MTAGPIRACPHRTAFDLHDPELSEDALWGSYAELRAGGGVSYSSAHGGYWILSRYEHVKQALLDHRTFSSAHGHRIPHVASVRSIPIDFDPPLHTSYRRLLVTALAPKAVRGLAPFLRETLADLVGHIAAAGGGDAVAEVALPLPLRVLVRVVGFSPAAAGRFRALTEQLAASVTDGHRHRADRLAMRRLLEGEIAEHRARRPDDYLTTLIDSTVLLLNASADRDEDRYPRPDEFDADRVGRGHLAFGWGAHQCVGAALARLELKILLETLATQQLFELSGPPQFTAIRAGVHYGLSRLPVRFLRV